MHRLLAVVAAALVLPAVVSAQGHGNGNGQSKGNAQQGQHREPEAQNAEDRSQQHEAEGRRQRVGTAWIPPHAMVLRDGKRWVAPAYGRDDFRLAQPWQQGHFNRGVGPQYVWQLGGGSRERFNLGGRWFALAPADYAHATAWQWNGDNVVIYPDTDHDGWYLAYNVRTGTYMHVRYLGA